MAKPSGESGARNRHTFDEAKFFKYLKERADSSLLDFLRSIDKRAWIEVSSYIIRYLRRHEEEEVFALRRQRGFEIVKALSETIRALKKAIAAYEDLAGKELPGIGALGRPDSSIRPAGTRYFVDMLKAEEERLTVLLEDRRKLYNEKRFGVSGNHTWLVMLQEFVSAWTTRELGQTLEFRSEDIAMMIEAAKVTLGWRDDKSETDPELIRKAISNFRKNQANAVFLTQQILPYVQSRCEMVAERPYLLGIEI